MSKSTSIEAQATELQRVDNSPTPSDLLRLAIEQKADPQYLRDLMGLQQEWEANEARKAYVRAMAAFKSEPMTIAKDKHVSFNTSKGKTEYDHATIGNVTAVICAALGRHGFSHRWHTDQKDKAITVSCVITHERGHFESTALTAYPDDSGGKNSIQQIASTVTYLQRYTLLAATGMATSDQADDDGRGFNSEPEYDISEWADSIKNAADMTELNNLAGQLKGADIPDRAMRNIRALWAARSGELK